MIVENKMADLAGGYVVKMENGRKFMPLVAGV